MINNRQAGRRRGRGGQRTPGGNPGRPDNGNRIDNRARGNAAQLLEKYKSLARDAQMQGDRVNTEYYLQFADHYFRVLNETRSRFEENQQRRGGANEAFDEDPEEEFDGDSYADDRVDGERSQQANGNRRDGREQGNRDNGSRDNGNRDQGRDQNRDSNDGYREARDNGRDQQPRDQQGRDQQGRDQQPRDQQRNQRRDGYRDQPRENREPREPRESNRPRAEVRPEQRPEPRPEQHDADTGLTASDAPVEAFVPANAMPDAEVERPRRGRPRRAAPVEVDAEPAAIEADRLPPALSISAEPSDAGDDAEAKPRRRRGRPAASEATPVG